MSTPDPKTVREIATEIILDCGRNADDVGAYVRIRVGDDLSKHEHEAWCSAIRTAIRTAVVTVEWPDEQQPADVVTAEQQQDGAAGRDEAAEQAEERYRNTRTHVLVALGEHCSFPHIGLAATAVTALVKPQLEAVYAAGLRTEAERTALAARVAELESEREADTRAVVAPLSAQADGASMAECKHAFTELRARFADRIEALDDDTDGGAE